MFRAVLAAMALALCASEASAQITTYVSPPRPPAPDPMVVATADSVRRDSVARAAITNMAEWVDSASGVAVPAVVGDSAGDPGRPVTTSFAQGAVAPATASDLPMLVLAGAALLVIGTALVTTRPRG